LDLAKIKRRIYDLLLISYVRTTLILLVVIAVFGYLSPSFLSYQSFLTIGEIGPIIFLISMGMGILVIAGEFDLSVGANYAVCGISLAQIYVLTGSAPLAILSTLGIGAVLGFVNGFIVTKGRVSSLIATLGTLWLFQGIALYITKGFAVYYQVSGTIYHDLFAGSLFGIPSQLIWVAITFSALFFVLSRSKFGNQVFGTGGNKQAARMMGINTDRVKIICFMIVGLLCALAAIIQTSRIFTARAGVGEALNLEALTAAVLGGCILGGGIGDVQGALLGAILVQILSVGFIMVGVYEFYYLMILGIIIIVAQVISEKLIKGRLNKD